MPKHLEAPGTDRPHPDEQAGMPACVPTGIGRQR